MAIPRYHIHLPAYLPTGPIMPDGTRAGCYHEGPKDLEYEGPPNPLWVPLNEEAVAAQVKVMDATIAALEEGVKAVDPKSRMLSAHNRKINQLKKQRAEMKVGVVEAPKAADPLMQELTMGETQKASPPQSAQPLKRPSDSNNRR